MINNDQTYPPFGPGQHLLSVSQFDLEGLTTLFDVADAVRPIAHREQVCTVLQGAVLSSLFFEPSTRTRLSFESAFSRLGGLVTTTTGFTFSSMAKGESIHDTARVISGYSDVLVVRHPDTGSVAQFAAASTVPVLNAGDGAGEHPSQALLDTYTMTKELEARGKNLDGGVVVAVLGDLKHGRTVHSLVKMLSLHRGIQFRLFAPTSLDLPEEIVAYATERGGIIHECDSVVDAVRGADVIYATRVQRERMTEEVLSQANVTGDLLNKAILEAAHNTEAIVMHPLPRDSRPDSYDLATDVDGLPGLAIFHQTDNGLLVRMALFVRALGVSLEDVRAYSAPAPWRVTA